MRSEVFGREPIIVILRWYVITSSPLCPTLNMCYTLAAVSRCFTAFSLSLSLYVRCPALHCLYAWTLGYKYGNKNNITVLTASLEPLMLLKASTVTTELPALYNHDCHRRLQTALCACWALKIFDYLYTLTYVSLYLANTDSVSISFSIYPSVALNFFCLAPCSCCLDCCSNRDHVVEITISCSQVYQGHFPHFRSHATTLIYQISYPGTISSSGVAFVKQSMPCCQFLRYRLLQNVNHAQYQPNKNDEGSVTWLQERRLFHCS